MMQRGNIGLSDIFNFENVTVKSDPKDGFPNSATETTNPKLFLEYPNHYVNCHIPDEKARPTLLCACSSATEFVAFWLWLATAMSDSPSTSQFAHISQLVKGFGIGGAATVISKTSVAPVERVKLILQLQDGPHQILSIKRDVVPYNGMVDCFRRVSSEQGVLSLWRGNGAVIAKCLPSHALNIAFRDYYRGFFLKDVKPKQNLCRFIAGNIAAGGVGAATTLVLLYPLDFARTRLAVDTLADGSRRFTGINNCISEVYRKDGLAGLYRGFSAALQFAIATRAIFFGLFDTMRTTMYDDPKQMQFIVSFLLSQSCLIFSGIACYPMDTVRRRLMMQSGRDVKLYKNTLDCWSKIIRKEGFSAFYKGVATNSLRSSSGALIISVYYEFMKYV
ncbi:hypothetical protein QR680_002230 [Steinernema hermaphroditum]|uniref:ADP/ATP translocase n=1 Tax=Steinernema hermaphroditum TaxID=289476 RepID=A0AA39H2S9_9BILA|nr:hypothetical protein QR680_002230 [Steinernema hermaphroditum]